MQARALVIVLSTVAAGAGGCAHGGAAAGGVPPMNAAGPPVSSYPVAGEVPPGVRAGAVHVISFGTRRLPVGPGRPSRYLHLRIAVENRADIVTWVLDPNDQTLRWGEPRVSPSFAEASDGNPVLTVVPGEQGYLDVYYLAPDDNGAAQVTLSWVVRRGLRRTTQTTTFDRVVSADAAYAYYRPVEGPYVHGGLGPDCWWWSDYYFWHHGRSWWAYPRTSFHRQYPRYTARGRPVEADLGQRIDRSPPPEPPQRTETSSWRGSPPEAPRDHDNWRGSPPEASSSGDSGGSAAPSGGGGGGGGDGKSSWRGGSGR